MSCKRCMILSLLVFSFFLLALGSHSTAYANHGARISSDIDQEICCNAKHHDKIIATRTIGRKWLRELAVKNEGREMKGLRKNVGESDHHNGEKSQVSFSGGPRNESFGLIPLTSDNHKPQPHPKKHN